MIKEGRKLREEKRKTHEKTIWEGRNDIRKEGKEK